ncbi:hypothetical protein ENKNEFLB_00785 [Nocardioides aquaticus]|uniref:Sulfotransferase domain-containing protein n=1 Tax=Nocardioides aquaticus TaxID=160826 RepID=A0ABX8EIB0_9ACTN|nr:sulfotransferase domain-containing protein [Nocardioides aquaticus]QVT78408.1 hypothetical protein ENKNEFLB_00785 [Nocardioides aquaticus]
MSRPTGRGIGGVRRSPAAARARALLPDPVVSGIRSAVRSYGSATASRRPAPEFLVIGAKKGGTTSVINWLLRHPQVMGMIPRAQSAKSPHYFDINYWRGQSWYLSHFPTYAARSRRAGKVGLPQQTGESSPYYLFHPYAAERIRATTPDARLIAILREPVSRAYSNYWDRVATGNETLSSFEEAVAAEPARLARPESALADPRAYDFDHDHHAYLRRGEYAPQLRRYFEAFPREQLLVLTFDELRTDAEGVFQQVQQHLGLEDHALDQSLEAFNVRTDYPKIDPRTRDRLRDHFAPHNAELEQLLGRPLGW